MSDDNLSIALRVQERFDAFFLGLIFTILGLSIQTAKFGAGPLADSLELLAWVSLLLAGLSGMSRAEGASELYRRFSLKEEQEDKIRAARKAQLQGVRELHVVSTGRPEPITQYIAGAEQGAAQVEAFIAPFQRKLSIRYRIMRYGFLVGVTLLVAARGLPAIERIIESMK